ncbi:MAG: methyltransferase domain-containing protein [Campylobacteraceae bacterium]|nr:methyltransferase domain-containing protein [Campylobacteraceae bacterium]
MKADIEIIAKSYDEVPYHSKVHPLSLPESLYMASLVHGLKAADIESANVLELGCASGVNIISFAANYPKANVVGVDLSKENIKNANNLAKSLDLKNAKFIESDIKNITSKIGKFDYIIAHGIYSWVSDEVKDAILRVIDECLNDKGVAYLSFNAYPGWKTKETIRDIMKFRIESKGEIDADSSINLGFDALAYVKNNAVNPLVRQVIDSEYENIISKEKNYIMHEYFEYYNSPNYLYEVAKDAKKHGLNYLCDAEYNQGIFLPIRDELKEALLKEPEGDRARFEQFIDFLTNRTFRRSL